MTGTFRQRFTKGLVLLITFAMLFACSSGGDGSGSSSGGTDVDALTLPSRIELTNVDDDSGTSRVNLPSGIHMLYSDAGTDYANEEKHTWVDDTEALDMINDILGVCKDTGYEHFVNQGPYKALVRQVGESKESQSGNNTTNTTTEQLMEMYVEVTRASNSAPMIVKIWVEQVEEKGTLHEMAILIRGHFTVTEGVSAAYPYGVMEAHFQGTLVDSNAEHFTMAMYVGAENGNVIIESVEYPGEGDEYGDYSKVQVKANADLTQGNAYVWEKDIWPNWDEGGSFTETSTELIAFNEDYFKVTEDDTTSFYSKDNLMHRVYNYKLFNVDDGSNLDMNSGFPIETADGEHAYIGYWGLWKPHGVIIEDGDIVTDMDGNEYTVFLARGKLTRHSQSSITLGFLNGMELSKHEWCDESPCTDAIITWNGNNFIKLGERNPSNGMIEYYEVGDSDYHAQVTFSEWDGAWCESLRAYLRLGSLTTPTNASTVYFHSEQTITPQIAAELGDLTLYTWEFTMDPINETSVENYNTDRNNYWNNPPTEKTFTFDASSMMLEDAEGSPVTLAGLTIPEDSDLQCGYHIGPLTETRYTIDNYWQAHESDEDYYTWNTGNNEWNQFATLKDSNNEFVSFHAPISFSYTHQTTNDINDDITYNGMKFRIEYDGNSVFIPWEFDETTDEWEPQINIKDGVRMGDEGEGQYVIKATEESLIMEPLAEEPDTTFPDNNVGAPDLEYDPTKTAQVGAVPEDAELKVIKGEMIE